MESKSVTQLEKLENTIFGTLSPSDFSSAANVSWVLLPIWNILLNQRVGLTLSQSLIFLFPTMALSIIDINGAHDMLHPKRNHSLQRKLLHLKNKNINPV